MEENLWKTSQANNNSLLDHSPDETFNFMQIQTAAFKKMVITEAADESFSSLWPLFYLCSASVNSVLRSSSKVVIHILPVSHFVSCFTFLFIFHSKASLSHAYEDLTRNWTLKNGTIVKIQVNPSFVCPVDDREEGKSRMYVGDRTGNSVKLILIYFLKKYLFT